MDLIFRKSRLFSKEEFTRRKLANIEGFSLYVASVEDVVLAKLEWAKLSQSHRQIQDVVSVLKLKHRELDRQYLEKWVAELTLFPEWNDALAAAGLTRQTESRSVIRIVLPYHLRNLAHVGSEVQLDVPGPVTISSVLDALETRYPMLCGTIRDHSTKERRAFLRFFACEQDLSHDSPDTALPAEVVSGKEPFIVIGAIAGG